MTMNELKGSVLGYLGFGVYHHYYYYFFFFFLVLFVGRVYRNNIEGGESL